jgi:mRNA interferase RelE/StbE
MVYRVERSIVTVVIVAAAIRKAGSREDIYRVASKLVRLGLL